MDNWQRGTNISSYSYALFHSRNERGTRADPTLLYGLESTKVQESSAEIRSSLSVMFQRAA